MARDVSIKLQIPDDLNLLRLPDCVHRRLQSLLDRQDGGVPLTPEEFHEAEGLVGLADLISLLRLRSAVALKEAQTNG